MSFLRRWFERKHGGGGGGEHHGSHERGHQRRYQPDDWYFQDEPWGRRPGVVPATPPDVACPNCRKSNAPGTPRCKQCDTPLSAASCVRCAEPLDADARFCSRCGNAVS
jgi:hypothetical protein